MKTQVEIRMQFEQIRGSLDERGRQEWAVSEAMARSYGGIAMVHRATGIVPSTIWKGMNELRERKDAGGEPEEDRGVRRPGGGRHREIEEDSELLEDLECLVEPLTGLDALRVRHKTKGLTCDVKRI